MAEEPKMLNILVTWRGKELNLEIASHSTLKELGDILHKLTNVKPDTMRLLVPQSTNKGSKLLFPFSDENSSLSVLGLDTSKGKSIRMMGVFENEIEEVSQNSAKPNLRIIGFDEEENRLRQLSQNRPQRSIKLPQGTYIFCDFRTLQIPGIKLNPPASEALRRMHVLASDPGIIAIMNKHRWRVQIMTEMAPVGYVGISPKCILGFNKNHGEEISLRLRTDDLKGFRKYESIKKTLLHELAHMVYSDHDANFFALDRQLNQEAASLDWTKSKGNTLGGFSRSVHYEEEFDFENGNNGQKLGGESPGLATNPRQLSAAAAYSRLLNASSNSSTVSDPDVMEVDPLEIDRIPGGSSSHTEIDEPDPDDVLHTESMLEAVKDDSMSHVVPVTCVEPDSDDFELESFTQTLDEPGPGDSQAVQSMTDETQFIKCHVLEKFQKEPDSDVCKTLAEPDPDDDMGGIAAGNFDSDGTESARKLSNLTSLVSEVPGTLIDAPELDDKIVTSSFIGGEVISSVDMDYSSQKSMSSEVSLPEIRELKILEDSVSIICTRLQKAIEKLRSEATPPEAASVIHTLFKIIRNVIEHPDEMKFRRLRKANPAFQRNVANYKAAMEILSVVGFYEDVSFNEIGKAEAFMVLKRNDPGLLWIAKSSLETCIG